MRVLNGLNINNNFFQILTAVGYRCSPTSAYGSVDSQLSFSNTIDSCSLHPGISSKSLQTRISQDSVPGSEFSEIPASPSQVSTSSISVPSQDFSHIPNAKLPHIQTQSSSQIQNLNLSQAAAQFQARTALVSDSEIHNEESHSNKAVTENTTKASEGTNAGDHDTNEKVSIVRNSVMPTAEEVTARRLETIARSKSLQQEVSFVTSSTSSTNTAFSTTTPSSSLLPSTSTDPVSSIQTAPNHVNTIAEVFQSISRAAVRNVEKVAALARSRSQGFGVEPLVVRAPEGTEGNEAIGVVHQSPEAMHMTISNVGEEDHHRQVHNHEDLVTDMMGLHAVSPSS
ncbi:hypothetical protein SK128_007943 [Halocaridina rubra]|uniref:Uncharacterized protein n=1 Tax=Halocaridina rubra TaxID=373956 RepID=A0AAN8XB72_HALRR